MPRLGPARGGRSKGHGGGPEGRRQRNPGLLHQRPDDFRGAAVRGFPGCGRQRAEAQAELIRTLVSAIGRIWWLAVFGGAAAVAYFGFIRPRPLHGYSDRDLANIEQIQTKQIADAYAE